MDRRRFFGFQIILIACINLAGCNTFVTYQGERLPDEAVATFNCYSRYYFVYMESCRVQAIDGKRPESSELFGNTSKILPGKHWFELAFEKYFGGGGGIIDVCAFDIVLEAGNTYQVKAHSLVTDIDHMAKHQHSGFYGGAVDLEITEPSGMQNIYTIRTTCSAFGGSMCRTDVDCVHHPDIGCFPQEGFPFGQCRFKDADQ